MNQQELPLKDILEHHGLLEAFLAWERAYEATRQRFTPRETTTESEDSCPF
jgi:hypothetical protein